MGETEVLEELVRRVGHLEELLAQRPPRSEAGPELRSARSIVGRLDDVWVAVREGNERLAAALEESGPGRRTAQLAAVEEALAEVLRRLAASEERSSGPALAEAVTKLQRRLARLTPPDLAPLEAQVAALGDRLEAKVDDLARRVDVIADAMAPRPPEARRRRSPAT
jgi:hypothetical protein